MFYFLRMRCRGRCRRRGRCAAVSAAGIHDDAGAFPGFNELFAGVRAVELQNEIVQASYLFHQIGGVAGKQVLLTFGLLSPNKGIEYALRALPAIIRKFPTIVDIVHKQE